MLQLDCVSMQLGTKTVLERVDLRIGPRERVAVVGRNGAGKSTLLRIAAGVLSADGGTVSLGRGEDLGYLAQDQAIAGKHTLWEEAQRAVQPVLDLERRAQELFAATDDGDDDDALMARLEEADRLHEAFRVRGGFRLEADIGRVLAGLGFGASDWERPAEEFSGGWQVRIALARLLLQRPSYLLLDEPTNHLDIETRTWLLLELKGWPGGVVVVGHDQDFLDQLVHRTIEVRGGGIVSSSGGYTAWVEARALRISQLVEASRKRAEERAHIETFVNRFRYQASKASAVQSRVKMLERMPPIEVPEEDTRARLRFPDPPPAATPMLEIRHVRKSYGDLTVFSEVDASLLPGDRILLVGPNGAGKSTLLRLLAGTERADAGAVQPHPSTRLAWFAQDQAKVLDPELTVLEAAAAGDPLRTESQLRAALGALLFVGDDVWKRCGVLSGGERSRVALAKILLQRTNLLLLDEPTNHLDVETKEAFAEALVGWPGSLVLVSHDRRFANQVANQVWEVGEGRVRCHHGDLDDFLWGKAVELGVATRRAPGQRAPDAWFLRGIPALEEVGPAPSAGAPVGAVEPRPVDAGDWEERKRIKRDGARRERQVEQLLASVDELERSLAALDAELASPEVGADWERMQGLLNVREPLVRRRDRAMAEWEQLEASS